MKQLLVIRVPKDMAPDTVAAWETKTENPVRGSYDIVFLRDNVERSEVEIVYNPHFKAQPDTFDKEAIQRDAIRFTLQGLIVSENVDAATDKIYHDLMMSE